MTDETHVCGRRTGSPIEAKFPPPDTWRVEPNGDRTCSFCGSLHHEDWERLANACLDPESGIEFDVTDKYYKFYVRQPGIKNAAEGGIKFYIHHTPSNEWAARMNAIWPAVLEASRKRRALRMGSL